MQTKKLKYNKITKQPTFFKVEVKYDLTVGKEYQIHGVFMGREQDFLITYDDNNKEVSVPESLFEK